MGKLINELGNKYGALTVIEIAKDKNGRTAWLCVCDCGNKKIVRGPDLRKGRITSCGCRATTFSVYRILWWKRIFNAITKTRQNER